MCNYSDYIEQQGLEKGMQQGVQQGMQQGLEKGRSEGFEVLSHLISKLLELGRGDDVARVARDPAYRDRLIAEFQLV